MLHANCTRGFTRQDTDPATGEVSAAAEQARRGTTKIWERLLWHRRGWRRWALQPRRIKMQHHVGFCEGHHSSLWLLLLNFISFFWHRMRVKKRCWHRVQLPLLPSRVEARGVLLECGFINGRRCWSSRKWKMGKNQSRAPSCNQTLPLKMTSSPVWTGMEQTFNKGKNETFLKSRISCKFFHKSDSKYSIVNIFQVTSKAAKLCLWHSHSTCPAANICSPAGWVGLLTKTARNGPAVAAACFQTQYSPKQSDLRAVQLTCTINKNKIIIIRPSYTG